MPERNLSRDKITRWWMFYTGAPSAGQPGHWHGHGWDMGSCTRVCSCDYNKWKYGWFFMSSELFVCCGLKRAWNGQRVVDFWPQNNIGGLLFHCKSKLQTRGRGRGSTLQTIDYCNGRKDKNTMIPWFCPPSECWAHPGAASSSHWVLCLYKQW